MRPTLRAIAILLAGAAALAAVPSPAAAQQQQPSVDDQVSQAIAEFGGVYNDPALGKYVQSLGELLHATTPMSKETFTYTVLDSQIVNAFATPGHHVFVTRGLLALANNEGELAGVLGHETGHITAGHIEKRESTSGLAQLGAVGAGLLGALLGNADLGNVASNIVGTGVQLYMQKFSRDQEFQADQLGVAFMARAGYDPAAMATFLRDLETQSQLEAQLTGQPAGDQSYNMMSDHPRTADRVQRAIAEAGAARGHGQLDRDVYLERIDGLLYGDDPQQGLARDRVFIHPALRFTFEVPSGFQLLNGTNQVQAQGPGGAAIIFDRAPQGFAGPPEQYLRQWAPQLTAAAQSFEVNGMPAATLAARGRVKGGEELDIRLLAIHFDPNTYYRFVFLSPPNANAQLAAGFERTAQSFRKLTAAEASRNRPMRIKIVTVGAGDTIDSLSARMPFATLKRERFLVLNGLGANPALQPGQRVKTIVE